MKQKTNEQAIKALIKNLADTPHGIGLAVLRERLLAISQISRESIANDPKAWDNILLVHTQYLDFCDRIDSILGFED